MVGAGLQRDQHRYLPGQKPNQIHATTCPDGWQGFLIVRVPRLAEALLVLQMSDVLTSQLTCRNVPDRPQESIAPREPDLVAMFRVTPLEVYFGGLGSSFAPEPGGDELCIDRRGGD